MPESPFIHERALVESDAIGPGTRISAFAHVMPGAVVGADCNICDHTYIEGDVIIGDRVTLKSGVFRWEGSYAALIRIPPGSYAHSPS